MRRSMDVTTTETTGIDRPSVVICCEFLNPRRSETLATLLATLPHTQPCLWDVELNISWLKLFEHQDNVPFTGKPLNPSGLSYCADHDQLAVTTDKLSNLPAACFYEHIMTSIKLNYYITIILWESTDFPPGIPMTHHDLLFDSYICQLSKFPYSRKNIFK